VNQILGQAQQLGINLIDTAECYGDHTSDAGWPARRKTGATNGSLPQNSAIASPASCSASDEKIAGRREKAAGRFAKKPSRLITSTSTSTHSVRDSEFFNEELWKVLWTPKKRQNPPHRQFDFWQHRSAPSSRRKHQSAGGSPAKFLYNRLDRRS